VYIITLITEILVMFGCVVFQPAGTGR